MGRTRTRTAAGIVLDTGALIALERGDKRMIALLRKALAQGRVFRVPAGVVAGRLDWNKLSPGGRNVNALTSERLTDIGAAATFYSTLVEVAKA